MNHIFKEELDDLDTFEPIATKAMQRDKAKWNAKKIKPVPTADMEGAVWQYLIDHSTPCKEGYAISFISSGKASFFKRVEARRLGVFKRVDVEKTAHKVQNIRKITNKLQRIQKWSNKRSVAYNTALISGPWWVRLAIKVRQKLTVFTDYWTTTPK